jgi:hypothetical protein
MRAKYKVFTKLLAGFSILLLSFYYLTSAYFRLKFLLTCNSQLCFTTGHQPTFPLDASAPRGLMIGTSTTYRYFNCNAFILKESCLEAAWRLVRGLVQSSHLYSLRLFFVSLMFWRSGAHLPEVTSRHPQVELLYSLCTGRGHIKRRGSTFCSQSLNFNRSPPGQVPNANSRPFLTRLFLKKPWPSNILHPIRRE